MEYQELLNKYKILEEENKLLKDELVKTKEHLKKYTAPSNMKKYYESHKEEIKQRVREYKQKTNYDSNLPAEKKKEYNRTAYLNRKNKLGNSMEENI
jgi:hypothetical protein